LLEFKCSPTNLIVPLFAWWAIVSLSMMSGIFSYFFK
jgi:hypothetical protein